MITGGRGAWSETELERLLSLGTVLCVGRCIAYSTVYQNEKPPQEVPALLRHWVDQKVSGGEFRLQLFLHTRQ